MNVQFIELQTHGDERGALVSLEHSRNIPFDIKRVYYMFDTKEGVERGFHAHRDLKQVAIVLRGSCRFILDDGKERIEILMDNPAQGLLIDSVVWREMKHFSSDCILMVLADKLYDEGDYIRNYEDFLEVVKC
ncbi:sugar 3,4-ketoisomerase [Enterobacter cloacae]|uniref:sugar 3,4-ketoisomerase n=1 Tax=Enterobacter cloacae TaxID=550 RepID=UPI000DF7181C|nr:FdtA/QdtA family cupin domain-containing protein [Enterobacter cloacae]MCK6709379.1 FdtA/QdtA family cupin domain-containing protein [Enterobacter cloacae]NBG17950.1 WxcM-like domain-containing protein [Enterobacter cloacae]RDB40430.1 WxcM-like domain-containing protein [Enterobacter cloacae]WIF61005.1 FdtA/QdtA family cupin domain-containing protein [Enterobacter cloacae]HDC4278023.1 WxcM-like domain-containing protein [Enterobacter cloacae]